MGLNSLFFLGSILLLCFALLKYIKVARKLNITTSIKRSTYKIKAVNGAGFIFPLTVALYAIIFKDISIYFLLGLLLVSFVSFIDDIKPIKIHYRLSIQIIASLLVFYDLYQNIDFLFDILILFLLLLGYLNTYNFMDGINGMLGVNTLIILVCLAVINTFSPFFNTNFLLTLIITSIIFLIGNFRLKPVFISGDIGSISLGFIIGYFILKIYLFKENPIIFLLMSLYFIDVGITILINLINKVNIFKSHRNHMYEKMVYERGVSDLKISGFYGIFQFVICCIVTLCFYYKIGSWTMLVLSTLSLIIIYFIFRGLNFPYESRRRINN